MNRKELYDLIDNRMQTIALMSEEDRYKVADLIKDTVGKFISLDLSDFKSDELSKIFDISKEHIASHAMLDHEKLVSGKKTDITKTLYPQVILSLRNMQLSLRINTENMM